MAQRRVDTADRILDVAEALVAVRGFNGFSYADVAEAVGVQKASLHHHFATKADLGAALLRRYHERFFAALAEIEASEPDVRVRLERYAGLYRKTVRRKRMCLCGMMATDSATLPKALRDQVAAFFAENEAWLTRVLDEGKRDGRLRFAASGAVEARFVIGALEGAILVARLRGGVAWYDGVARVTLAHVLGDPMGAGAGDGPGDRRA